METKVDNQLKPFDQHEAQIGEKDARIPVSDVKKVRDAQLGATSTALLILRAPRLTR